MSGREIMEQPEAISRALKYGGRFMDDYSVIVSSPLVFRKVLSVTVVSDK